MNHVREAVDRVSNAAYQAGRCDELARAFTLLGDSDKAQRCLREKVKLQKAAENLIEELIPAVYLGH